MPTDDPTRYADVLRALRAATDTLATLDERLGVVAMLFDHAGDAHRRNLISAHHGAALSLLYHVLEIRRQVEACAERTTTASADDLEQPSRCAECATRAEHVAHVTRLLVGGRS